MDLRRTASWLFGGALGALIVVACNGYDFFEADRWTDCYIVENYSWLYDSQACIDWRQKLFAKCVESPEEWSSEDNYCFNREGVDGVSIYGTPICAKCRDYILDYHMVKDAGYLDGKPPETGPDDDTGADASSDGATAKAEIEHCVPPAPSDFNDPQMVWFGPLSHLPTRCPPTTSEYGDLGFFDLQIPASGGCPICVCGSVDKPCSAQVSAIHFQANTCNKLPGQTTDFPLPANWEGSCTNEYAIPAGEQCPPGSGQLCVQSVSVSALPEPVQGCKPEAIPVPKAISDDARWKSASLACTPDMFGPSDPKSGADQCFIRHKNWRSCVKHTQDGIFECPQLSAYTERMITYSENAIKDHRFCTDCTCKASGGSCSGTMRFYADENCNELLMQEGLSSNSSECHNFSPPGSAVGSLRLDVLYDPGTCEPQGGEAMGDVGVDSSLAKTWCCLKFEPEDAPQGIIRPEEVFEFPSQPFHD